MSTRGEYFQFERTYQTWLDSFYESHGWRTSRVTGPANRAYDLTINGVAVEEKCQREHWDALVVEFWQDWPSREKGWATDIRAERLIWIDGWWEDQPYLIMSVDWPRLKDWMRENHRAYEMLTSTRGYGETKFKKVPWSHIVDLTKELYYRYEAEDEEAWQAGVKGWEDKHG